MPELKCYKILLWKAYFDKGIGITNYIKYFILFFGVSSLNLRATMIIATVYFVFCIVLGKLWYKYKLVNTEIEIQNKVNPFVTEMRKVYKD